ncbi:MAG: AAA family ATPase [Sporichthyaceae bacterium]
MRLHRMAVTAFGPFAGTETVDFDALADAGLFLFTGATGAGKTSILDAVCFALYGQVPGTRAGARGLRSDHAPDAVAPEVRLEVTLRGRRLRLTRSPQWERPRQRGAGTVTRHAKVLLEELTGSSWSTLSTRLDETGDLVGRLLGLRLAQFCQVVLLPQNQFAEFLRADAEKRRELLESLFDTRRFADVERWLVAARKDAFQALADVDARLDRVVARVAEAAGEERPDDLAPETATAWVAGLLALAGQQHADAQAAVQLAGVQHDVVVEQLEAATLVAESLSRRRALVSRLAELESAAPSLHAAAAELAGARAVAPLVPMVTEVARVQVELDAARAAVAAVGAVVSRALPLTGTGPDHTMPPPAALTALARDRRGEAAGLRALARDEAEADRLAAATDDIERRAVDLDDRAHQLQAHLDSAPARRSALEAARDAGASAAAAVPGAEAAVAAASGRLAAAVRRDELRVAQASSADAVREAVDRALGAREDWLRLRQARLDGMAAELAAGLHDGAPCPVCGSGEHPTPAAPGPEPVSRDDENTAEAAVRGAEALLTRARDGLAVLDADLAAATATAGGDEAVAAVRTEHDRAVDELARTLDLAADRDRDAAALAAFGEQHETWLRERVALDSAARALRQRAGDERGRLAALRSTLDAARGDDLSIAARALRLVGAADDLEALGRQVETAERLDREVARALSRAQDAAGERGVGSLEQVLQDHRAEPDLAELEHALRRHEAELAAVHGQLCEPVLAALESSPSPDFDALRAEAQAGDALRTEASLTLGASTARAAALTRLAAALRGILTERAPVADRYRTVDALARLAEGKSADNRLRMSLSGYVLAARLEQVAVAASERLLRMSSQRYQLMHTAEGATGRTRGGLLLRVLDAWTGVERDPATLSGGESFCASLALALGLADVVTAEAGGTLLETLFVDEGFGSLDEEALDEVMGVLDDLRDGGRTVGLVSHVADLRQRVPVQLQVVKARDGSHVRQ